MHKNSEYECANGQTVKQVIITSISAQLDWVNEAGKHFPEGLDGPGEPEFLQVTVNGDIMEFQMIKM